MGKRYERLRATRNLYRKRLMARGYMEHTVYARKKAYTGASSMFGDPGTANPVADVLVQIDPSPLLFPVDDSTIAASMGRLKSGDIRFMQIDYAFRSYFEDPSYEIVVTAGPQFMGVYSQVDGETLEVTPYALAVTLRWNRP